MNAEVSLFKKCLYLVGYISLKSKKSLSFRLSFSDDWDYCKELFFYYKLYLQRINPESEIILFTDKDGNNFILYRQTK